MADDVQIVMQIRQNGIVPGPILQVPNVSANALNALTGSKRIFGTITALVGVVPGDCLQPNVSEGYCFSLPKAFPWNELETDASNVAQC